MVIWSLSASEVGNEPFNLLWREGGSRQKERGTERGNDNEREGVVSLASLK
jgi:hypothetical protein